MEREHFVKSQMCSEHTCIGLWPSHKLWPGKHLRDLDKWFNHSTETTLMQLLKIQTQDVSETNVVHEKKDTDI